MEKVAALYRVSTPRQVKKHRDDEETLPVQRNAIHRFIDSRHAWELVKEYSEEGVSAYLNHIEDRDIIQQILADAKNREFTVLVLFKYDRLARQCLDYLTLLVDLKKMGVKVWTVADDGAGRDLKLENLMDYLLRFLEGWQGQSESYNTSVRVAAKMQKMAEDGEWTGGTPFHGFQLKNGGKARNGSKESLEINETEAAMDRYIVDMYLDLRLGSTTISRRLNDEGYRRRNGKEWDDTSVREILNNPIIAGRPAYGRHYRDPDTGTQRHRPKDSPDIIIAPKTIPELEIISWERWLQVQERMAQWQNVRGSEQIEDRRSKAESGPLLLTGIARCGYCHGSITAGWSMPVKTLKDGTKVRYRYPRYVDRSYHGGQTCEGQGSFSVKKLDGVVLAYVRSVLERMDSQAIYQRVRQQIAQGAFQQTQRLKLAKKREQDAQRIIAECARRWKEWLLQSEDERKYSEEFLTGQIREAEADLKRAKDELQRLEKNGSDIETRLKYLDDFLSVAPTFWQMFLASDPARQKIMLRSLLKKVEVYADYIHVHWRINVSTIMGKETNDLLEWQEKVAM
jgi:site-specific DNA recombinase